MLQRVKKFHVPIWLLGTATVIFLLRIPSFFEPYYYGDEMIYLTLGNAIRKGLILYKDIHDNKTPLLYFLAAISGGLFWFRAILCFWMILTTIVFWKLIQNLFPKNTGLQKIIVITFAALTTLPLFEGQIANAELFMILPTVIAISLVIKKKTTFLNIFFSGVLISVSALFKVPAIFDAGAIFFLILLQKDITKKSMWNIAKSAIIFTVGISIPILISFAWYWIRGAFSEYLTAAFLQNIGYVASTRTGSIQNNVPLLVKLTPIIIRGGIVTVGLVSLFLLRRKLTKPFIISTAWLLTSLFAVTLSERPYPHYLIQIVPSISILLGILFTIKMKEQVLTIIPLTLAFFIPAYYNFWYYPITPYFSHFSKMITSRDSGEYFSSFDSVINRNYKIAMEITQTTSSSQNVFIWGDSAPIYALSKRLPTIKYVANYHIWDYSSIEETVSQINKNKPKLVVLLPGEKIPGVLYSFLLSNYKKLNDVEDAQFWYNIEQ